MLRAVRMLHAGIPGETYGWLPNESSAPSRTVAGAFAIPLHVLRTKQELIIQPSDNSGKVNVAGILQPTFEQLSSFQS